MAVCILKASCLLNVRQRKESNIVHSFVFLEMVLTPVLYGISITLESTSFGILSSTTEDYIQNLIGSHVSEPSTSGSTSGQSMLNEQPYVQQEIANAKCDFIYCGNETTKDVNMSIASPERNSNPEFNWGVLLLAPIVLFGIGGNILVCMAVSMEKRLQSVTNYFLLSLAITDLLVCLLVMPFSIIHESLGYWPFDAATCDIFVTSDVLMCTSSILHLMTISLERYVAIRSPLSSRKKSKAVVIVKIIAVWATSVAISSPIMILGLVDNRNILHNDRCVLSNDDFIIYGSVSAFFIPLGLMVIFFGLTIRLLRKQARLCDPNNTQDGTANLRRCTSRNRFSLYNSLGKQSATRKYARRTQSCPVSVSRRKYPDEQSESAEAILKTSASMPNAQDCMRNNRTKYTNRISVAESENEACLSETIMVENSSSGQLYLPEMDHSRACSKSEIKRPKPASRLQGIVRKHQAVLRVTNLSLLKKDSMKQKQVKNNVKTEQKASKVLGIVFAIFVICWTPFFIVNVMTALCRHCHFERLMISAFVWLGYVSSTLNPIIYTMFNKTFRITFIKLLRCQYSTIQKSMTIKFIHIPGDNQETTTTLVPELPL